MGRTVYQRCGVCERDVPYHDVAQWGRLTMALQGPAAPPAYVLDVCPQCYRGLFALMATPLALTTQLHGLVVQFQRLYVPELDKDTRVREKGRAVE